MKKDTLQSLESVLKVLLKVTALSIALTSVILVTRPICLKSSYQISIGFVLKPPDFTPLLVRDGESY